MGKIPFQQDIFPKEVTVGNQIWTPFSPTTKPHPLNPLDRGPTSLVLAGYRLVVPRPFCACFTIFCVCLPHRVCRSRLVLFCSTACFVLFLHTCPTTFVIFLWFGFSFLHMIPAADTSCRFLFLFSCFFILVFTSILLYKRFWAFVGQIMLTGSKRSWAQFIFVCRSHPAKELYSAADLYSAVDPFPLHFFLWTSLALWSFWWVFGPYFSLGFPPYGPLDMDSKNGHQQ